MVLLVADGFFLALDGFIQFVLRMLHGRLAVPLGLALALPTEVGCLQRIPTTLKRGGTEWEFGVVIDCPTFRRVSPKRIGIVFTRLSTTQTPNRIWLYLPGTPERLWLSV